MARTTEMEPTTETKSERETPAGTAQGGPSGTHATQAGTQGQTTGGTSARAGSPPALGGTSATPGGQGLGSTGGTQGGTGQGMSWGGGSRERGLSRRGGDLFESLLPASPFGLMRRMFDEMDRLFEGFPFTGRRPGYGLSQGTGQGGLQRGGGLGQGLWAPQIEVSERGGNLVVCADLPGLRKEDLHVEVQDGNLILQGERRSEQQDESRGWSERSYGRFYRSIPLPDGINPEQANASFRDGVLEVTVPLPPEQQQERGRKIEVR